MSAIPFKTIKKNQPFLQQVHEDKLRFRGKCLLFEILGKLSVDLTDMTVMLVADNEKELKRYRRKINLYDAAAVQNLSIELSELTFIHSEEILSDLDKLTDLLEIHREENLFKELHESKTLKKKSATTKHAAEILRSKDLTKIIHQLLIKAGTINDQNVAVALYIIGTTSKNSNPIHAVITGDENSGKSHLIETIINCFPPEQLLKLTRITGKSLYYFPSELINGKILMLTEFDNMDQHSLFALRELQEHKELNMGTTRRDRFGNLAPAIRKVQAKFSSFVTVKTTNSDFNHCRNTVIFHLKESPEQTHNFINKQNALFSGETDLREIEQAQLTLNAIFDLLKPKSVINPYAAQLNLPVEKGNIQNMHTLFLLLINQVALLHQFQRKTDALDRIIVEKQDIVTTLDIFESVLFQQYDNLPETITTFNNRLMLYLENRQTENNHFTSTEIREHLNLSKSFVFRALDFLIKHKHLEVCGGTANRGYHYTFTNYLPALPNRKGIIEIIKKQVSQII